MLDARIASALNKIIQNSYYKKKVSLEEQKAQKEDPFLGRRRIAYMIYDYFPVTGAHVTVLDYAELLSITSETMMFKNSMRDGTKFYCRWARSHLDDVLESLYKLRIRESDQLKNVLGLNDLEIHQKISKPDYQRLKTMVKRSIDQKLRLRNFYARNERIEIGAVVTNRRGQRGVERGPGECYQWKAKWQCSRGDSCSFRHDENKRAKSTPKSASSSEPPSEKDGRSKSRSKSLRGWGPSGKLARQPCRDDIKGKCTRPSCDYWHPPECQFYKKRIGGRGRGRLKANKREREETSCTAWWTPKDPLAAVWRSDHSPLCGSLVAVSARWEMKWNRPRSLTCCTCLRRATWVCGSAWCRKKSFATFTVWDAASVMWVALVLRAPWAVIVVLVFPELHVFVWRFGARFWWSVVEDPSTRTDLRKRLKDKSDAPAEMRGELPRISISSKTETKLHTDEWSLPAAFAIKMEKRESVVDFGASMHKVSRKDLSSAELDTVNVSKNSTTMVTANGEVPTKEEVTVYVRELDLFVTEMLLEDSPAVLSLGKLCEDHGHNYHRTSGQKPHLIKNGRKIECNTANYRSLSLVYRQALQAHLHLHLVHLHRRKP